MPIHIGDYKRDTGHLRAAHHGAYLLLLFHHWSTGSLPDDDEQLASIACMTKQEWKKVKQIIGKFFCAGWIHSRVLDDLADAKASYERRAAAGKEGGKARACAKHPPSIATALPEQPLTTDHIDRIGSAGTSNFTEGSKALASAFWKALGFDSQIQIPPEFAGVDWRAIGWETAGWTVDLIETEAKRIGPDKPLTYHEKVFATAFAKRQSPLPVVEIREAEKVVSYGHGKHHSNSVIAAIDRQLAAIQKADGIDLEMPESVILSLPGGPVR